MAGGKGGGPPGVQSGGTAEAKKAGPGIRGWVTAALLIAMVAVSFAAIFVRLSRAPALAVAAWRVGLALAVLGPMGALALARSRPRAREVLGSCLAGGFLACHLWAWTTSLGLTSLASSVILVTSEPLFVMLGSRVIYGEGVSRRGLAGAAVAIAGSLLIGAGDWRLGPEPFLGDLLALSGAFLAAAYFLTGRGVRRSLGNLAYVTLAYGTCFGVLYLVAGFTGTPLAPYPAREWLWFALLALGPTVAGHTLLNWALGYVPASSVAVTLLGEPVGATALAVVILGEMPAPWQVVGGVLVVGGIYLYLADPAHGVGLGRSRPPRSLQGR
ncbi:MAG: DMT family transporter [Acetobacteraceae bacterium]|nr:DMT family transporter [Acetobacteraceae bacterium]